ncbi:MAG TPA: ferredoxin--NADP reductase [Puia sp.]|jgi:ring-1,2-phenylacetyl-CoA epoxidase subunit PaaE|nr:ferredoxin--NADP reductase [Puia sp.]
MDRIRWKVSDIVKETESTHSFVLQNETGVKINYQAGQFLTFIFNSISDGEIRRSYSFSSTPGVDDRIAITVKRITNGEISRHLLSHIHINDILVSIQPAGRFTVKTNLKNQRHFFFIAAGSGIVPIFSLIKKILHEEPLTRVFLIYQNHNESEIIFKNQLEELRKKFRNQFKWVNFLSKAAGNPHYPRKLNNFLLEEVVGDALDRQKETLFYLCGPPSFMRMAQFTLRWMGFHDEQIKIENFTVERAVPLPLITDTSPKEILIHYNKGTFKIKAAFPTSILEAALNYNIQLPYSCRAGRCSSCIAKCIQGKVIMSNNEILTEKDLENGLVLTCVGYAQSNLELEF